MAMHLTMYGRNSHVYVDMKDEEVISLVDLSAKLYTLPSLVVRAARFVVPMVLEKCFK